MRKDSVLVTHGRNVKWFNLSAIQVRIKAFTFGKIKLQFNYITARSMLRALLLLLSYNI